MAADEAGAAARLADARERYDAVGGATAEKRASSVLKGLGFSEAVMRARCDTLSGGWQMRVALARTLLSPAGDSREAGVKGGLLLLDEPSNHLDGDARAWLVNWIKSYAGTVVLVSHDEELLACVDRIVEVRGGKLGNFKGDYARFLGEREARRAQALSALEREGQKAAKLESVHHEIRRQGHEGVRGEVQGESPRQGARNDRRLDRTRGRRRSGRRAG